MSSTDEATAFANGAKTETLVNETKAFAKETKTNEAKMFTNETKTKDIALSSPQARQVLEEAGVDYCCGGGKSLHDACLTAGVSAEEILGRLRENSRNVNAESANWVAAPLSELTRHIREEHHQYVRAAISRIEPLMNKVNGKHGSAHPELGTIQGLFGQVGREMLMHMQKEEYVLFPYIEAMERAAKGSGSLEKPFFQTVRNPIQTMMKEHDAEGDLVRQIRVASAGYTPPAGACTSFKALYDELKEFEADLHQHVHLENNILFPRAAEAEAAAGVNQAHASE